MFRLSHPAPATRRPPSAAIARARLSRALDADRRDAGQTSPAHAAPVAHPDELLAQLLDAAPLAERGRQ